jgi:hypothetical protein
MLLAGLQLPLKPEEFLAARHAELVTLFPHCQVLPILSFSSGPFFSLGPRRPLCSLELWIDIGVLVQPMPGAVRLTRHLRAHGIPIAVATSSVKEAVALKLRQHRDWFDHCFGERIVSGDNPLVKRVRRSSVLRFSIFCSMWRSRTA